MFALFRFLGSDGSAPRNSIGVCHAPSILAHRLFVGWSAWLDQNVSAFPSLYPVVCFLRSLPQGSRRLGTLLKLLRYPHRLKIRRS